MATFGMESQESDKDIMRKKLDRTNVVHLWVVKGIAVFIV